jgi:uncharacterized protein GlcG (DUF336 family)
MRTVTESFLRCALLIVPWLCPWAGGCDSAKTDVPGVAAPSLLETVHLTAGEVQTIIAQAATEATKRCLPVTIAVVDHTGVVLGVLQMAGAKTTTTPSGGGMGGLEGRADITAKDAAISKAGTAAFFSTQGSAFTTRTASFIVQEHFPPEVNHSPGGPLFGVQFSNLRCSDVNRGLDNAHLAANSNLPLGLSADPGGLPLYKEGVAVGGIGVEGDGEYTLGQPGTDPREEIIAAAGTLRYPAPAAIRGDSILVNGFQLVFANAEPPAEQTTTSYDTFAAAGKVIIAPAGAGADPFDGLTLGGTQGTVPKMFATGFMDGTSSAPGGLKSKEVTDIISRAAAQADKTRTAIRLPIGTPARVTISVVDASGNILGIFRTLDAPIFGFDVSVQKARTAAFFSQSSAWNNLSSAKLGGYVTTAAMDGVPTNRPVAFSTRAVGFLSQPIFPPGAIASFPNGPFSKALEPRSWSIFNTGLQLDMYFVSGASLLMAPCTGPALPGVKNGITIFPGGFPLYKMDDSGLPLLVGAIGVSGDGVDQDDYIAFAGSKGYEAPAEMLSDKVPVLGVNLPYGRFPRNPNL